MAWSAKARAAAAAARRKKGRRASDAAIAANQKKYPRGDTKPVPKRMTAADYEKILRSKKKKKPYTGNNPVILRAQANVNKKRKRK